MQRYKGDHLCEHHPSSMLMFWLCCMLWCVILATLMSMHTKCVYRAVNCLCTRLMVCTLLICLVVSCLGDLLFYVFGSYGLSLCHPL